MLGPDLLVRAFFDAERFSCQSLTCIFAPLFFDPLFFDLLVVCSENTRQAGVGSNQLFKSLHRFI
jgi:hypothetical protein